jgi:hypothetical protein
VSLKIPQLSNARPGMVEISTDAAALGPPAAVGFEVAFVDRPTFGGNIDASRMTT